MTMIYGGPALGPRAPLAADGLGPAERSRLRRAHSPDPCTNILATLDFDSCKEFSSWLRPTSVDLYVYIFK